MTPAPCPWCGSLRGVVHVHGHGQCRNCGTNVEPCCSGADGQDASTAAPGLPANVSPELFGLCFDAIGGRHALVTGDALLQAILNRIGGSLDDARLVREAGERIGLVQVVRDDVYRLR